MRRRCEPSESYWEAVLVTGVGAHLIDPTAELFAWLGDDDVGASASPLGPVGPDGVMARTRR
uniref:Uncharacterized protein n=1 Tax=uncultured Nocardioidaceae bacterium TaxID=253824 RepID=A0A6J4MRJ8_9ACTN|nr:MAG: hypothetical protein AVDCRST_MAG46-3647 [uncultured Nocardioidaceae bacterium]